MRSSDWSSDVCSSDLAFRPGHAESRPWMACGGESGMDACRAEEHAPTGTTLCPKPAYGPSDRVAILRQPGEENSCPPWVSLSAMGAAGPALRSGTRHRSFGYPAERPDASQHRTHGGTGT